MKLTSYFTNSFPGAYDVGVYHSRAEILPSLPSKQESGDIAACYARLFSGSDGKRVLEHLQLTTLHRAGGPDGTSAQIHHLEGQRYAVMQILRQIERGRKNRAG